MRFEPVTRAVRPDDREWILQLLVEQWGSFMIVTRGTVYDGSALPRIIAERNGERVGLVTYRLEDHAIEIVSLNSLVERIGIGSALLGAVLALGRDRGCRRIWLITTNDNMHALRFYQKRGFKLVAVYPGALDESRNLKPEIPLTGLDGIPLRDEIELEYP